MVETKRTYTDVINEIESHIDSRNLSDDEIKKLKQQLQWRVTVLLSNKNWDSFLSALAVSCTGVFVTENNDKNKVIENYALGKVFSIEFLSLMTNPPASLIKFLNKE